MNPFSTPSTHLYEGVPGGLCKRCGREECCVWHEVSWPGNPPIATPPYEMADSPAAHNPAIGPGNPAIKRYPAAQGGDAFPGDDPHKIYESHSGATIGREEGYLEFAATARVLREQLSWAPTPDYFQIGEDSDDVHIVYRFRALLRGVHQIIHTKARTVESAAFEGDAMNEPRPASTIDVPEKVEGFHIGDSFPLWFLAGEAAAAFWKWYQENR